MSNALDLLAVAAHVAGGQQYPAGALYVVATPIGNLADLSLRAVHALAMADAVACEDTRVSGQLLRHLGLHKPLIALHQHNEREAAQGVCARLQRGERIAFVSDAGTPAVSDPGARLVAEVRAAGLRAIPLPGASAPLAALSVAGDAQATGFRFVGFLPPKGEARAQALAALDRPGDAQILFEAPHRIATLAQDLAERWPERLVTCARELTKQFETVTTLTCANLPAALQGDANAQRGEFALVLHAQPAGQGQEGLPPDAERMLQTLLNELPLKQAVGLAAQLSGVARNALYARALELKGA
ncbi:16S rRNA (cytidine(1402)-2'-O)-methyltransferase [Inhella gelatinilytica]|uniref:Ribosomal RNA small subunit methyltransferase I n=1 Tax=Inhella gelatinilytica TaxID=2795030 RepID=A0A931IUS4_9BURK|nr:16S rRNA (cytidine(1402)-2'-O)-methyltransferase [Inhella gelatinilytica]MBH9551385.1 16S rRNA (cytidine(1402)-2'-O)-methyltransferase [Inhella gelatinilytica]